jgi:hypothetical protein
VTPCQVFIASKHDKPKGRMVGIENKQGFEALLVEIEASGEDPMLFMREELMETIYQEIIDIL